ncbi:MAG: hypothetical protein GF383_09415 [Candidatus Lokiarchaeota archaeon]|nr:hypothetical protein [Candidatus Lokiarchaeota archaeon]MBD3340732.1 hypothetical protein [Candidatus Lokiarchaeota archaeon]
MTAKKDEVLINNRLKEYQNVIIDYFIERANFSGQSDTLASIIGYLTIYGTLTQSQLQKLTKFSKSTISTGLSNLINVKYVKKEKIPGKREYKYFLSYDSQESIDDALGSVKLEINFLRQKIRELREKFSEKHFGYTMLMKRLSDLTEIFELYQVLIKKIKDPTKIVSDDYKLSSSDKLTQDDFETILNDFDPKIKKFENEIIDFFRYESAYSTLKSFMLIVFVYFLTRKVLTQKKIRKLTNLSVGKISQVVNMLIRKGHIAEVDKRKYKSFIPKKLMRQKIYAMISVKESFFVAGINSLKQMVKWENKFKAIAEDLKEREQGLNQLYGYNIIEQTVSNNIELMEIYKNALKIFSRLL